MKYIIFFAAMLIAAPVSYSQIKYPETRKADQEDDYFGTTVKDPYRWLEDDNSAETKAWVEAQNKVTQAYLSQIPFRKTVRQELEEVWNYPKYGAPFRRGAYYYFYKNDGLQNQSVLYRQRGHEGVAEVFLDPNTMSRDGTAAISTPVFSKGDKYAAYMVSQAGSDWQTAYIMSVDDKKVLDDKIEFIKFSNLSWDGNEGFFYSRYPAPDEQSKLTNQNVNHALYYHKVGRPQSEDVLIYEDKEHPYRTIRGEVTKDKRFLLITKSEGTSGSELWAKDLSQPGSKLVLIVQGFDTESNFVDHDGGLLLVRTNAGAPNYRLVTVDPANPGRDHWKTIVPEANQLLQSVGSAGGQLFLNYLSDASSRVVQADYKGRTVRNIALPGIGSVSGLTGRTEDTELFYTFTSFNAPATIYRYEIKTGNSTLYRDSEIKMKLGDHETRQVFFESKDGTRVPMFVTHKKGLKMDGNNPVMLYGYGGFNIPMTPAFSVSNAYFVDKGGIYVVVNLRGGNEYGEAWHSQGMLLNKQNVFDDMIGAAEHLIKQKYTNPGKIAVRGGSNGGLLVGAVITQRPDLFKVAIPQVGVMDMLRYHQFTIGWAWATEYGRSDDEKHFKNLYAYSPLHNLKQGVSYPATMVTTADHDDRVVPAHSFKFAAALQEANGGPNPMLIRIETNAGHGAGKPTSKQIDEAADIWSFVMYNLGMNFKAY